MRPGAPSDDGRAGGLVSSTTRMAGCRSERRPSLWKSTNVTSWPRAAKRFDNSQVTVETGPMSDVPIVPLVATSIILIMGWIMAASLHREQAWSSRIQRVVYGGRPGTVGWAKYDI